MPLLRLEQAVYGSFPFWDRGYDVLGASPDCRPEWLAGLRAACQRFGERPAGVGPARGLFALRLPRGPWMVVGVDDLGADDHGRGGALAFHALFLSPREYQAAAGGSPFPLVSALRTGWTVGHGTLPSLRFEARPDFPGPANDDGPASRIAAAISSGRRVVLESPEPIDELAREVWSRLTPRARRRASLATWAFSAGNRFDLVAVPKTSGLVFDSSYVDASTLDAIPPGRTGRFSGKTVAVVTSLSLMVGLGLVRALGGHGSTTHPDRPDAPTSSQPPPPKPTPDEADEEPPRPGDRVRVAEGLVDLADRCGVDVSGREDDPSALMTTLADRLRYRGPDLSANDRARLAALADSWDARIAPFRPDRPLPQDFARRSLRAQLRLLAWSFHLPAPRGPTVEIPTAIAEALAIDAPPRPGALADDFPALADYARFLDRLPRK